MNKKNIALIILVSVIVVVAAVAMFWESGDGVPVPRGSQQEEVSPGGEESAAPATGSPSVGGATGGTSGSGSKPSGSTAPPAPSQTDKGIYVVSYEDSGFKPKDLIIPVGKSVKFINNSSRAMRVYAKEAEYPHSALNQSVSVGRGGIYIFLFPSAGLWEYYNLNNPKDNGSVAVY